jgi:hypothetical protein
MTAAPYTARVSDEAERLEQIVADLPWSLTPHNGEALIEALMRVEVPPAAGPSVTARLLKIALDVHGADPMLWASKFLSHLPQIRANQQTALDARNSACAGARQAKVISPESTYDPTIAVHREPIQTATTLLSPELLDTVLSYAGRVNGTALTGPVRATLTEAACVALTMLDPATTAKRPNERLRMMQAHVGGLRETRLGWQIGQQLPAGVARSAARLLVGWGGSSERGLLWHVAHETDPASIPAITLTAWRRDLAKLDPVDHTDRRGRSRTLDRIGRHTACQRLAAAPINTPGAFEQLALAF